MSERRVVLSEGDGDRTVAVINERGVHLTCESRRLTWLGPGGGYAPTEEWFVRPDEGIFLTHAEFTKLRVSSQAAEPKQANGAKEPGPVCFNCGDMPRPDCKECSPWKQIRRR